MEGAPQTQRTTVRPEHRPGGKGVGGESTHTPTLTSWRPSTCLRTSMPPPSHPLLPSLPPSLLIHPSMHLSFHSHVHPPIARFTHTDSGHVAPAAPGPARQASACLSIPASVYSPHDYFPVHLPLVPLCIHRSIHESIHYPSVLPSTHPPTQPPVHHPSIYPSVIHSSIHNLSVAHLPIPQTVTEHLLGAGVGDDSKAGLVLGGRPHEGECAPFQSRASRGEIAHFTCTPTRTATPLTPESTPRGHGTGRSA